MHEHFVPLDGRGGEESIAKVARDPTYFFPHDLIVLKVEDTLFRIPLFYLLKHLHRSGDIFDSLSQQPAGNFGEENPFVVGHDISADEFRHFLRIILPSMTENLETVWTNKNSVSKDEWISVLKISTLWRCLSLRSIAIHALQSKEQPDTDLTPLERILLGREYSIASWVLAGYTALVTKGGVSDLEMEEIGAVESFRLMRIIQEMPKSLFRSLPSQGTIKQTFHAELSSIAAAEKAYSMFKSGQVDEGLGAQRPQVIDPSIPLLKLDPRPCNEHYLLKACSTGKAEDCKYSHNYALTPEQLTSLALNAKKIPCHWLRTGGFCPHGSECCWGHVCPNGAQCNLKGKCRFKGASMHPGRLARD